MAKAGYNTSTGPIGTAGVALVANTATSILTVIAPAQFGIDMTKLRVGFDGVTASAVPAFIELCDNTLATNSTPGTNNTTGTVVQAYGRTIAAGFTSFYASTSEPTVLSTFDRWTLTPNGGLVIYDWPLGSTHDTAVSAGVTMRVKAPAVVNVTATIWFERC
jgi:hypothetical protein